MERGVLVHPLFGVVEPFLSFLLGHAEPRAASMSVLGTLRS
jgi:hypothetical protein